MPKQPDNNNRMPKQTSYRPGAGRKQDFTSTGTGPTTRASVKDPSRIPSNYLSSAGNNIISNQKAAATPPPPPKDFAPKVSNPFSSTGNNNSKYNLRNQNKSTSSYSKPSNSKRGPFPSSNQP